MQTLEQAGEKLNSEEIPKITKINRENISLHLVQYQLRMIGMTIEDARKDEQWYTNNTMSQEMHDEFKAYAIALLKKTFKCNKTYAEQNFGWFDLQFGLKIK